MSLFKQCWLFFFFLCISACASAPSPVWTSRPAAATVKSEGFSLQLEPLKNGRSHYVIFRLSIQNKSSHPIEVDWNRTRYIHNGKLLGGFVFQGVEPSDLKNKSIPRDVIPPGGFFTRQIAPAHLVAWAPLRERNLEDGKTGFLAGNLPAGQNGVDLALSHRGREIRQKAFVQIFAEPK